jgi:phosphoglycerol transferase
MPTRRASPFQYRADISAWTCIAAICFLTFFYFSTAFTGQNLHVWGDEVIYRIDTMRENFSEVAYPGYLFLWVYAWLPSADGVFPEAVRAWNAGLLALAVPFIYATCRLYTARKWSVLIAALSMAGPFSTYSAYFMPDVMYFTAFCIFAWFCLRCTAMPALWYGALAGGATACLSMIKPHGLFILIAFMAAQCIVALFQRSPVNTRNTIKILAASLLCFVAVRGFVGWQFAGSNGLSLLGDYSDKLAWQGDTFGNILKLFFISFGGHALALAFITGPTVMALCTTRMDKDDTSYEKQLRLRAFAGCMVAVMFAITILFTTKLAEGGHASETARLHMRYYNLFFPLLYLVLAIQIGHPGRSRRAAWVIAACLLACIASVQFGSLRYFVPLDLDAPELSGILRHPVALPAFSLLAALAVAAFAWRPRHGAWVFLGAALPVLMIASSIVVTADLGSRSRDDMGDAAGKQIGQFLGASVPNMGLFGDVTPICQVMFYAGNPSTFMYPLADGVAVPDVLRPKGVIYGGVFPNGKKAPPALTWAVVFGERKVPAHFQPVQSGSGWKLFKITAG